MACSSNLASQAPQLWMSSARFSAKGKRPGSLPRDGGETRSVDIGHLGSRNRMGIGYPNWRGLLGYGIAPPFGAVAGGRTKMFWNIGLMFASFRGFGPTGF